MRYLFIELETFAAFRPHYFSDDEFQKFQQALALNPSLGAVVSGTGSLRKVRWSDSRRGKGKRGGSRTLYYLFDERAEIWLFTVYGKDVKDDLTAKQRAVLRSLLDNERSKRL